MNLENAVKYLIQENGKEYLTKHQFVNALNDICVYDKESQKFIINIMVKSNILSSFIQTQQSEDDIIKLSYNFSLKTGIQQSEIEYILKIIKKAIKRKPSWLDLCATRFDFVGSQVIQDGIIYSEWGEKLLKAEFCESTYSIKDGTEIICNRAFEDCYLVDLEIPQSIEEIGDNAIPHVINNIVNHSNRFIVKEGILYDEYNKRIVCCINNKCSNVIKINSKINHIDKNAFFDKNVWSYDYPPYIFKLNTSEINYFETGYALVIVPNKEIKEQLILKGFKENSFIVGDIYEDEFGVIYSSDKKKLLCFPKELAITEYQIIDNCEKIEKDAFNWLPDPDDDGSLFIIGNNLKKLKLPQKLESIGAYSLQGLTELEELYYPKESEDQILRLLGNYKDYYKRNIISRVRTIAV